MLRRALFLGLAFGLAACRAKPPEQPPRGDLVVAYPIGPHALVDPENEEFTLSILANVTETLVELDEGLAVRPGLAESWHTPDELTWVFELRPGLRLHDGRLLDAATVASSLEHTRTDPASRRRAELTAVVAVDAVDQRRLRIKTRFPFGALPNRLANVPISVVPTTAGAPPVGTGPYQIRTWSEGGDTELEAFAAYRKGAPTLQSVRFRVVPEMKERLALLRSGAVHIVLDVPPEEMKALGAATGVRTVARKGLRVVFVGMNCGRAFKDVQLRKAVALAVDRAHLVAGPLGGLAEAVDQVVAPEVFGFDDSRPVPGADPDQARRLVQQAAARPSVDLEYIASKYRAADEVAAALASDLAGVGIRVTPRATANAEFFARLAKRQMEMYLFGWMSDSDDAGLSYAYLVHTSTEGFGENNGTAYSDPDVDRLIEEATLLANPARRREKLRAVAARLREDVPVFPLYRQTDLYAVAAGLEFEPRLDRKILAARIRWKPQ